MEDQSTRSPLDVPGVDIAVTTDEIVAFVRAGRRFRGSVDGAGSDVGTADD